MRLLSGPVRSRGLFLLFPITIVSFLSACHRDMYEEPKFLPDQENQYFPGMPADRRPVEHTVPRGSVNDGSALYTGEVSGALVTTFPIPVTPELIARGQEAFDINCSACHGRDGYGQGIVVQRGFPPPPSLHTDRLRNAPVGHFFKVMTQGYGAMYPFRSRVSVTDRWAIISYIRALQFSQHVSITQLESQDQAQLGTAK